MDALHLAEYVEEIRERNSRLKDRIADGSASSWDDIGIWWAKYANDLL